MLCSCVSCGDSDSFFNQLSQLGKNLRYDPQLNENVNFLSVLGNVDRMMIMNVLKEKDRCVCELEAILDKSQPSISHHLRELEKFNLIQGWKKGKFTYYRLNKENFNKNLRQINSKLLFK